MTQTKTNALANYMNYYLKYLYNSGHKRSKELAAFRSSLNINDPRMVKYYAKLFGNMPKTFLSTSGTPTYAENAIFLATKCYAILQQSNDNCAYNSNSDKTLFKVLHNLRLDPQLQSGLDRRVNNVLQTVNSFAYVQSALPQLIRILKSNTNGLSINFTELALDLYKMQFTNQSAQQIILLWGQQYY